MTPKLMDTEHNCPVLKTCTINVLPTRQKLHNPLRTVFSYLQFYNNYDPVDVPACVSCVEVTMNGFKWLLMWCMNGL